MKSGNLFVYCLRNTGIALYRAVYQGIIDHDGIEHAGYLAYLSMLSLFPFLVLLAYGLGYLGEADIGTTFIQELFSHLPPQAIQALQPRIDEISAAPPEGLVTLSVIGAIWTASSAVEGLRTVLNRAYHVSTPPAYIFRRLMSIVQLLVFTAIVIVALMLIVFAPLLQRKLEYWLGLPIVIDENVDIGNLIFSFSAIILFFVVANLYYILPNIRQGLMDVIPGACATVAMWLGAASGYSYYLSTFDQVNVIYGSLGGIIASLIFFFLINLCFIIGAELNYHLADLFGTKLEEKEHVSEDDDESVHLGS